MTLADETPRTSVLVVDDRPENLLALEVILQGLDVYCARARSGEEALAQLGEGDYAVVLLDVQMPGLDGFETAKLIRGRPQSRQTPIIFLTAYEASSAALAEAYSLGAVDYLVKPLVPDILRAKVMVFVDLFRKAEQVRRQAERLRALERREFEKRLEEEALRRSQRELADFVENAPIGLHWVGPDGTIQWANRAELDLLGYTAEEYLGRHIAEFHADAAAISDILCRLNSGENLANYEARLRCKDGFLKTVLISSNVLWEGGKLVHTRCFTRDITPRKHAEDALREASLRKDEFLAMLAHELRNPLAPIRNALHIVKLRGGDHTAMEQVREIVERQVGHMARLIDDLLDVTRLTRGRVSLHRERLDLAYLARLVVQDHRPAFDAAVQRLELEVPETPVWVLGDATRLTQILDNLLENAQKFTDRGGCVTVRVAADLEHRRARLGVRDTGIGVEPQLLGQVFDAFAQADRSLDRSRGGLGLGLAIVKGLAELHGGSAEAASAGAGRGAEFRVTLALEHEPAALTAPPAPLPRSVKPLRVLVVEDNRDSAESLRLLLHLVGYQVTVAHTGAEGVAAAEHGTPDVVLCDIGLPGLDGYGVARALRTNPRTAAARLIAVTGYGQEEDRQRTRDAGFDQHLVKPVNPEELLSQLESVATVT